MMIRKMSTRIAFTESLMSVADDNPDVVLVCADSVKVIKSEPFMEKYPQRAFDVGIAEQNAVACAAGMAASGLMPFVATYAGFITMRACEQVRTFIAYPGLNVKLAGANGGMFCGEREGVTHQFFEDLGILRTMGGFTIVVPADAAQVKKAVKAVSEIEGPAYLRLGSGRDPVVFEDDVPFELGKARILKEYGSDAAIFTNGSTILRVLEAADILSREGIKVVVVEVHTLKPLDTATIAAVLDRTGAAVTVEDHNIIGGLGSAVSETACEECPAPVIRIGLRDCFPESGEGDALLDKYRIGVKDIMEGVKRAIIKKEGKR